MFLDEDIDDIINRVYCTDAVAHWTLNMYTPEMKIVAYGSTR